MAKFEVKGLKQLEAELKKLPRATRKNNARKALRMGGEILARDARLRAPRDEYNLLESIDVLPNAMPPSPPIAPVMMYIGPGRHPQAITQEFGTEHHPPQPFMRPAWDTKRYDMLDEIAFTMWEEVQKSVARAARKAGRGK